MTDKSNHRRKTIGVLINWTVDSYQQMFLDGVMDCARQSEMSCIIFEGGTLNSPHEYEMQRNLIFPLASENTVDGLVILPTSIGLYTGKEKMRSFCAQFNPTPMVSISMDFEDIPSVLIDNRSGMRELIVHLIEEHAYRRFAFVAGPAGNEDAEQRQEVFDQVLREHKTPFDPRYFFRGDFSINSGIDAAKYFLGQGIQNCDAVVVANDGMAVGVIKELTKRKVRVPEQIAVTGFDNIDLAGSSSLSLTTVKHPIYEQGWTATKLIADLLAGKEVPRKTYLPTRLVVRESCKCVSPYVSSLEYKGVNSAHSESFGSGSMERRFPHILKMLQKQYSTVIPRDPGELGHSPTAVCEEKTVLENSDLLAKWLDEVSMNSGVDRLDYETFRSMVYELWENRTVSAPESAKSVRNEDLIFHTIMRLSQQAIQRERTQIIEIAQERQKLELIQELLTFMDIPGQMSVLARRLPDLGIASCYLSFYRGDPSLDNGESVCMLGIRDMERVKIGEKEKVFSTKRLVPDDFLSDHRQHLLIVESLRQFGFVVFEIGPKSSGFAALLSEIISGAMQAAMLFEELKTQKDNLSRNLENMRKAMSGFIQMMASTVEARDPYTAGHQRRVSDLARTIAQKMNLPPAQVEGVRMAGIIHDLGKINVPAEILNRPGILDDLEWSMIKRHPKVAYDILKNIDFPWPIAEIVYQHHERINGGGYPNGLKGDAVILEARILAVADVVEAMSSHRPYRDALGLEKALEEINKNKGILYDPVVVDVCTDLFKNKMFEFRTTGHLGSSLRKN